MLCFAILYGGYIGFLLYYRFYWPQILCGVLVVACLGYMIFQNKLKVLMLLLAAAASGAIGYAIDHAGAVYTSEAVYVADKNSYGPVLWKNENIQTLSDGNLGNYILNFPHTHIT